MSGLPVQEMAFEVEAGTVADPDMAVMPALLPEEEMPVTVSTPMPQRKCPDEIVSVAQAIGNLADRIGKSVALQDRFAVQRLLQARWAGETNMSRLAAMMGIARPSLYRLLERGEQREHPAYELFRAAFTQGHAATVLCSLEVVREAAHSGNYKAALDHLRMAAGDLETQPEVNVTENRLVMNFGGKEIDVRNTPTSELIELFGQAMATIPQAQQQAVISKLPPLVRKVVGQ